MKANFFGAVILCVFVCSADQMTTVAQETTKVTSEPTQPTTEPSASNVTTVSPSNVTTVGPSNVTTVGPSNVTTEGPTTAPTSMPPTTIPPPPKSRYEVIENSTACLIMEGSFQLKVTYTTRDNKTASTTLNVPESSNVKVTGTCASGNETNSSLTITPKDGEIKSLTFNFQINDGKSILESWMADVNISDAEPFNHSVNDTVDLTSPNLYYKCDKEGNFSDSVLAFIYRELKVQAFNVKDGDFSDTGYDCPADAPNEPAPGKPPVQTYTVSDGNKTCVVFKGGIQFNIPYNTTKGNPVAVISVPTKTNISGECSTTLNGLYTQELKIGFYDTWELKIYFSSNKKQNKTDLLTADAGVDNYDISQIELMYDYNNNLFKDVDDSIVGRTDTVTSNQTFLSTSSSKSYMCNKDTTFALPKGLTMVTTNLQFQAFRTSNTTDFDAATECAGDEETNSIVPIAVGAALAGLVIIVLIAYLIGRKRSRSGYEQV